MVLDLNLLSHNIGKNYISFNERLVITYDDDLIPEIVKMIEDIFVLFTFSHLHMHLFTHPRRCDD
jgi:hypothetical protein